jgi:hypothetical protein
MSPRELLARLEGATSGHATLDCLIAQAIGVAPEGYALREGDTVFHAPPVGNDPRSPGWRYAEPYTTSLDAAVALCERLLPRWTWEAAMSFGDYAPVAEGTVCAPGGAGLWRVQGPTPALALCRVIITAWSAQQERGA